MSEPRMDTNLLLDLDDSPVFRRPLNRNILRQNSGNLGFSRMRRNDCDGSMLTYFLEISRKVGFGSLSRSIHSDDAAAAFEQNCITPDAVSSRDPFASAHFAETVIEVQRQARMIFGKYARLQSPDAAPFRSLDQRPHQSAAD